MGHFRKQNAQSCRRHIGILFSKMPCQCLCSTTLYNALSKYTRKIQGGLYNVAELLRGCLLYSSAYLNAKQFDVFVGIIRREQLSAAEYKNRYHEKTCVNCTCENFEAETGQYMYYM